MAEPRQNVIVVGAGVAGIATAREIAAKLDTDRFHLIVVNPRPYFVHLPGLIRTVVTTEGSLEKEIFMPWGDALRGKGEVKVGKVVSFTETKEGGEVVLRDGERLPYAALVLAPGTLWEGPLNLPDDPDVIEEHLHFWRAKIETANSYVLAGGGAIGLEMAGELKDFYPTKTVTIVHGGKKLANDTYPTRFRKRLFASHRKNGTEIILNDYLDAFHPEDDTFLTRRHTQVKAELLIPTRGGRPNTEFVSESLENSTTGSGHIFVLPTLQLPNHSRIFAAGDVIDWKEQKQAMKAGNHASVVAKNVLSVIGGAAATARYNGSPEIIILTNGRSGGTAYMGFLWGLTFGDWFARTIKSRGLVIEMIRSANGLGKMSS